MADQIFLHPGDFHFAQKPSRIETILGSCVSLTMRDPMSGQAAMCHCLLPRKPQPRASGERSWDRFHYVDTSIEDMLGEFQQRSVPANRLEIKLFGGANVIEVISEKHAIGSLNWQLAHKLLEDLNLPILAHDVGGKSGRRIVFETGSGDVMVKRLGAPVPEKREMLMKGLDAVKA